MQKTFDIEHRMERKYVLSHEQKLAFDQLIQLHPAHFKPIYHPRFINNVYYDTADFAHFRENVAGVSPRRKVRVRWYDSFENEQKASLEIKSKVGEVVSKFVSPINFSFGDTFTDISTQLDPKHHPKAVSDIISVQTTPYLPVITNRYLRGYFISQSGKIRLTIDTNLSFGKADNTLEAPSQNVHYTIVELKYGVSDEEEAADIASQFPFSLSKSSKYQQGVAQCYPHLVIL